MKTYVYGIAIGAALLGACSTQPAEPMGTALREMVAGQTVNPDAARQQPAVVEGADPVVVQAAVVGMRAEALPGDTTATKSGNRGDMTIMVGAPRK